MNFFKKVAAKFKNDRRQFTVEVAADIFDEAGKAFDEANDQYEVELIVPETRMKVRLVDRKRSS